MTRTSIRKDRDSLLDQRELLLDSISVALAELDLKKVREAAKTLEDVRGHIEDLIREEEQEAARTRAESSEETIREEHDPLYDHG